MQPGETLIVPAGDYPSMLAIAIEQARKGFDEGGVPVGAALFHRDGHLLARGHNRRVQENDPSIHGETDAFRKAGRQRVYRDTIMVTSLAPCWYCSGLIAQFKIGLVVVGSSRSFSGGVQWLRDRGVPVVDLDSSECDQMISAFMTRCPDIWAEDVGEL
jgi:cytosine/creatinine deaminase